MSDPVSTIGTALGLLVLVTLVSLAASSLRLFSRSRLELTCRDRGRPELFGIILARRERVQLAVNSLHAGALVAAAAWGGWWCAEASAGWGAWSLAGGVAAGLLALLVAEPVPGDLAALSEEIRSVVDEGQRGGLIEAAARTMIHRVMELHDEDAASVMTPRTDMICLGVETSLEDARRQLLEAGHTRVPVVGETTDDIVGILYAKDLLGHLAADSPAVPGGHRICRRGCDPPGGRIPGAACRRGGQWPRPGPNRPRHCRNPHA